MADQELKACPMCGKSVAVVTTSAEMWPDYEDDGCADSFAVMCDASAPNGPGGCGASGGFAPTEAKAIAAWNTRSEPVGVPTVQAGEREELIALCRNQIDANLNEQTMIMWTQQDTPRRFLAALNAAPSQPAADHTEQHLAMVEPSAAMLDAAVAFALNVSLHSGYGWTDYMRDLWKVMIAARKNEMKG